jgi:hypothetical protein
MDDGAGNNNLESNLTNLGLANAVAYVSPTVNVVHVAMYLGDLERGENVLAPGGSLRFLVVIEDKVKK